MARRAKRTTRAQRRDVAAEITAGILAELEKGIMPWRRPWLQSGASLPRRHEGTPYTGVNHLLLSMKANARGYGSPFWMTAHQANALGAHIRKGERATMSVFYGTGRKRSDGDETSGDDEDKPYRFLKYYWVFNAQQIEGLPERYDPDETALDAGGRPLDDLEAFFARLPIPIEVGGDSAHYSPARDTILMPSQHRFDDSERFYATLAHEICHAVGASGRLNRESLIRYHDSRRYRAEEELVCELAAAMIGAHLGFESSHIVDHSSYIASWLRELKSDQRLFLKAAGEAQRAVDWIFEAAGMSDAEGGVKAAA